jgi:hypothetical protein
MILFLFGLFLGANAGALLMDLCMAAKDREADKLIAEDFDTLGLKFRTKTINPVSMKCGERDHEA